jgi:predicted nucleic acid-binding protein
MIVLLDTGPLGRLTSPKPSPINRECLDWLISMISAQATVLVPEICDYELRRELARGKRTQAIKKLDDLRRATGFLPINSSVMLRAAELWAEARNRGLPTAHDKALDGDVILASAALQVGGTIATEDVGDLRQFVDARHWRDIKPPSPTQP